MTRICILAAIVEFGFGAMAAQAELARRILAHTYGSGSGAVERVCGIGLPHARK